MKSDIRSNVVINLIRTITMTLLSFVAFPLMCRILGDAALGAFSWASAFVYYFIILSKISIPNIAVRECAKVKDDPVKLSMKIQEFFILQAIMSVLSFGLMCVFVFTIPSLQGPINQSMIFILSINFLSSVFAFEWVFTALEKQAYLAIRSIIILTIVDILIFAFVKRPDEVVLYAFLTVLVTVLTVISNLIYLPKLVKFKKTGPYNFKQYLPTLGILFSISLVVAIYSKSDSFILGIIDETKASVGSYSVGMKGVDIIIGFIVALGSVFMPRASYYLSKNETKKYNELNAYATNICFVITIPAIALMSTLATPITALISGSTSNAGYTDANWVLISLASLMLTFSLGNIIYTQILIPSKREKLYLLAMGIGSALNVGLSLLFGLVVFKDNPAVGIAIATAISDLIILLMMITMTWKESKDMIFNLNNLKIIGVGTILAVFAYFVGPLLYNGLTTSMETETAMIAEIGIVLIASIIIYIVALIILKEKLLRRIVKKEKESL